MTEIPKQPPEPTGPKGPAGGGGGPEGPPPTSFPGPSAPRGPEQEHFDRVEREPPRDDTRETREREEPTRREDKPKEKESERKDVSEGKEQQQAKVGKGPAQVQSAGKLQSASAAQRISELHNQIIDKIIKVDTVDHQGVVMKLTALGGATLSAMQAKGDPNNITFSIAANTPEATQLLKANLSTLLDRLGNALAGQDAPRQVKAEFKGDTLVIQVGPQQSQTEEAAPPSPQDLFKEQEREGREGGEGQEPEEGEEEPTEE